LHRERRTHAAATVRIIVYNRNSLNYLLTQVLVHDLAERELDKQGRKVGTILHGCCRFDRGML
jgi:hypothetical protein